jgi:hypothetical protein
MICIYILRPKTPEIFPNHFKFLNRPDSYIMESLYSCLQSDRSANSHARTRLSHQNIPPYSYFVCLFTLYCLQRHRKLIFLPYLVKTLVKEAILIMCLGTPQHNAAAQSPPNNSIN